MKLKVFEKKGSYYVKLYGEIHQLVFEKKEESKNVDNNIPKKNNK